MKRPVLIMAGGTGGHVFPALALARMLRARLARGGVARHAARAGGARGAGRRIPDRMAVASAGCAARALRRCWPRHSRLLRRAGAGAARSCAATARRSSSGLGGFVTGPGGLAAWLCRRPLIIHEQNAIAGFTNRCLARLAREVLTAFPGRLRARRRRARDRQPGAQRHRGAAGSGAALRRPQWPDPHPRRRRQPGRGAPQQHGAAGAGRGAAARHGRI